ncbi:glycosyltransferase family 4 protein [bacterium]|jgi:glycosyltransferase involved in cell wall biosynthesis|nr:glycosyltransferase family 4 protein [bacterium]MBT4648704.1 glycosyltransferase family 4 protein [bacterium]
MSIIGLEATRANRKDKTGTEWYAWHLLEQFKKIDKNNKFIVYYNKTLVGDIKSCPTNFILRQLKWPFRKLWTHLRLSFELIFNPVDKFFASNAVPLFTRGEVTVTVHDLGFFRQPKLYHPLEKIYHKVSHRLAITRANKIIAVSQATANDIIKYFPKVKNKIKVIYNGWDQEKFKPVSEEIKTQIKNKYNLPAKFILYIGRIETKKNIQNLVKAFALLKDTDYHLVLAGRPGNFGYEEILALTKQEEIKDRIHLLGYVEAEDYQKLIAATNFFIFPSKFEGFGIPILEAMGCGVPVLSSDIPVLKEVGGKAAIYFNPNQPQDIADKLDNFITDRQLQVEMINYGKEQAVKFSWTKCAQETLDYILE